MKPGERIANDFEIVGLLGEGAFGAVYLCRSPSGLAAVKILRRLDVEDDRQRIREEARRWVELGLHSNVVFAAGIREHARMPCIIMEYVEGARTLQDVIAEGGGWRLVLWIAAQSATGLDYAWKKQRLLHRDIKPANILISSNGLAKIGDFGLATSRRLETDQFEGARIGTPYYMAPEIWDGAPSDPAADIYAFGATFYQAASGRWPYEQEAPQSIADVARCHQQSSPASLLGLVPEVSRRFAELITNCLEKAPARRPQSFEVIAAKLNALAQTEVGFDARRLPPPRQVSRAEILTNAVSVHLAVGDFKEALNKAEQAVHADPHNAKVWTGLAAAQAGLGRVRESAQSLLKGLSQNPDPDTELSILHGLAHAHYQLSDKVQALGWLTRAIADAERYNRLAALDGRSNLICELMPYEEALSYCDRILADDPNAATTWNNRAIACRRNGDTEEAEYSASRAVALNPRYAKAWTSLANAQLELGKFHEAITSAQRSVEIEPKTGGAYLALHIGYSELGEHERAMQALTQGSRLLPDHPLIKQALAAARSRQ